jgi:hypothetical protein
MLEPRLRVWPLIVCNATLTLSPFQYAWHVIEDFGWLLLAYGIAFVINLFPAFKDDMDGLAFFRAQFGPPILP